MLNLARWNQPLKNLSLSLISAESHLNSAARIACIRECYCSFILLYQRLGLLAGTYGRTLICKLFLYLQTGNTGISKDELQCISMEPPTPDTRNNGLSVIGTESHSNSTTISIIIIIMHYSSKTIISSCQTSLEFELAALIWHEVWTALPCIHEIHEVENVFVDMSTQFKQEMRPLAANAD